MFSGEVLNVFGGVKCSREVRTSPYPPLNPALTI